MHRWVLGITWYYSQCIIQKQDVNWRFGRPGKGYETEQNRTEGRQWISPLHFSRTASAVLTQLKKRQKVKKKKEAEPERNQKLRIKRSTVVSSYSRHNGLHSRCLLVPWALLSSPPGRDGGREGGSAPEREIPKTIMALTQVGLTLWVASWFWVVTQTLKWPQEPSATFG